MPGQPELLLTVPAGDSEAVTNNLHLETSLTGSLRDAPAPSTTADEDVLEMRLLKARIKIGSPHVGVNTFAKGFCFICLTLNKEPGEFPTYSTLLLHWQPHYPP